MLVWLGMLALISPLLRASTPWENRAYEVVLKLFEDGINELAAPEAESFLQRYPGSEKTADVALVAAQADLALSRPDEAISVLTRHRDTAGDRADEFAFWLAQSRFRKNELADSARGFD